MGELAGVCVAVCGPFPPLLGGMSELAARTSDGLEAAGAEVRRVDTGAGRRGFLRLPGYYFRAACAIRKSDMVHVVAASGLSLVVKDFPAVVMARLMGRGAILNFVGGGGVRQTDWLRSPKLLAFRLSHRTVVPTERFRLGLSAAGVRASFAVIPNVVDVGPFAGAAAPAPRPILLSAKSLEEFGGHASLLEILAKVQRAVPDAELHLAGDGPLRPLLEQQVRKAGLQRVRFLGPVAHQQMPDVMGGASVFVHAAKVESFGIALVEAMAAGLPVVAFGVGGVPDVVQDGVDGFVVQYGDLERFASLVVRLLQNKDERDRMARAGRSSCHRFTWPALVGRWAALYRDVLEEVRRSPRSQEGRQR